MLRWRSLETLAGAQMLHWLPCAMNNAVIALIALETLAGAQMLHYVQHDKGGVSCPRYATRGIGNSA
jgi:hypothetical protein